MPRDTDRPSKCELNFIRSAARRVVEIFTFRTTTPGLTVTKEGATVTINYTPDDDGGGPGGDIGIPDVIGLEDALAGLEDDVTDLGTSLAGKTDTGHSHAISDVTSLQATLDGKAAMSHSHATSDVTGLDSALAGKAATSHSHATSDVTGLDSALAGKAATSHSHATSDVTGLDSALAGKAATSHSHATSDVTGLDSALSGKAATSHSHATSDVTGLDSALAGKAATSHSHAAADVTSGTFDPARLPVATTSTIGGVKRNAGVAGQYITGYDSDGNALFGTPVAGYRPNMNYLINGDFLISQRGETIAAPNDGAYTYDRWYVLSDGNGVVDVTRPFQELKLEVNTASKKFGLVQLIEPLRCEALTGLAVTFSFSVGLPTGSPITDVRAMIVTRDASSFSSRDFVSAWNSSGVEPTPATGWTVLGTTGNLNLTPGSINRASVVSGGSTPSNCILGCMVWVNSLDATVSDRVILTGMQLEPGTIATDFAPLSPAHTLNDCQRYYEVIRHHSGGQGLISGLYSGTQHVHTWYYKAAKRIAPTISLGSGTSWIGGTPTITPGLDHCYFTRAAGAFIATGTSGNVALAADAEL